MGHRPPPEALLPFLSSYPVLSCGRTSEVLKVRVQNRRLQAVEEKPSVALRSSPVKAARDIDPRFEDWAKVPRRAIFPAGSALRQCILRCPECFKSAVSRAMAAT